MQVFLHHIYEYQKGLRNLILHTLSKNLENQAVTRLEKLKIPYFVQNVSDSKINLFFGEKNCVDIVRLFGDKPLNEYLPEEDFILGIMLGYGMIPQCSRYITNRNKHKQRIKELIA
ncbi:MAG TPA: DUF2023 family protein [Spirochaetota bacterium]|nr:DUF2023 family protein [Spirochaetota bacterium]HOU85512.1 DUF2023 family protein [Spirochaetota bacterium]HQE59560.1 DUF2023 family protein [Spirochaetota bacterium]